MVNSTKASSKMLPSVLRSTLNLCFFMIASFFLLGQTLGFSQCLGDNPLQLAIGATELVRSPSLNRIHGVSINAKDKTLSRLFSHSLMV